MERTSDLSGLQSCGILMETTMTPVKKFRLINIGDARRLTKGSPPTTVESLNQPGTPLVV